MCNSTLSRFLTWRIPWTMGRKESDTTELLSLSKLTLKIRSRKKPQCYPKLSSPKAPVQIMSQVSSKKPSNNNFNYLKFSNTNGENTNCRFFSKACMTVKQKSGKYSRKKKKHYSLIQFMNINKKILYKEISR